MSGVIERQVIVNWYTPEEKMPPDGIFVVVSFSGKSGNIKYDHTFGIADWFDDGLGWIIDGLPEDAEFTIHAWCDLMPYGGENL